jgi:hypothetical protein
MSRRSMILTVALLFASFVVAGCAAGNPMYEEKHAGFWAGLWHGMICVVTFIISLFTDRVGMYEANNVGEWYDLGFLLGAAIIWGSGACKARKKKIIVRRRKDKEWEEIAAKVEDKVKRGIRRWAQECEEGEKEWEDIGEKIEEKIKRELRDWAER